MRTNTTATQRRTRKVVTPKPEKLGWEQYLQKNHRSLQQKMIELENLEMMSKHGPELWRQNNHRLEVFLSRMQRLAQEQNTGLSTGIVELS
ncbi:PREDICTED: pre-mRNA-splicing factor SPF27 homolog [Camelina sativa]|uniref:Pre-mRNA-splicing factor SPF27 homolog n=1 Tax=Camelina sativa TaxID=90675 RepID=A0ABM0WZL0_CAMSA|nr:PREDICTED: pre-mRNA-splicing factor SPF27 homolog [Camelina sativa]